MRPRAVLGAGAILSSILSSAVVAAPAPAPKTFSHEAVTVLSPTDSLEGINEDFSSKERSFGQGPYGFKHGLETFVIENMLAKHQLELFVGRLKVFVNDTDFDIKAFDSQAVELSHELIAITISIESIASTKDLAHQLYFAKYMFNVMLDSSHMMKLYSNFNYPGHRLVYNVVELNVRTLALSDTRGALDLANSGYLGKILRLYHSLIVWDNSFKGIVNLPLGTRFLFDAVANDVGRKLEALRSWVPRGFIYI